MRCTKALLLLPMFALLSWPMLNQAQQEAVDTSGGVVTGSLWELRNSRNVLLMVRRSNVVDSRGLAKTILNEAYKADSEMGARYPRLFNLLARKLNNYMKKYQSISAVKNISDADFIVFFNLLEYRRPLGFAYPYGEMFVILNKTADGKPPRIVWKTRKGSVWAEDAIEEFIKEFRAIRGEG